MTATDRLLNLLRGKPVDRPPFMPAIYDLKPILVGSAPHTFGQEKGELIQALIVEADELESDALTVGYDIYNVEAEAAGCRVTRSAGLSMPEIGQPLLGSLQELDQVKAVDRPSGRMDLFIGAAAFMLQRYENAIPVRGGISGPFSMAAKLYSQDALLINSITDPGKLFPLLSYCTDTIKTYARGFAETGAGVVVFDSFVSPPLLSPETYRELVWPFHRELFRYLEQLGVLQRSLIIGGNTIPILEDVIKSGATQFLLDYTIPLEETRDILKEFPDLVFRVNLPPAIFGDSASDSLDQTIRKVLQVIGDAPNLIVGTGILSQDVPPTHILRAKRFMVEHYA